MLYKNKKNVLRGVMAFVFMLTLSLSTALSPLAKAEEARWAWKTLTTPPTDDLKGIYVSPDGSKLFALEKGRGYATNYTTNLWMSADNGATWRKIFSKQATIEYASFSTGGSKIVMKYTTVPHFYISTDDGQSWTERHGAAAPIFSPDGSFLVGCSVSGSVHTTYISTDDGQTWTQKGTNSIGCPSYVANNGTLIAQSYDNMAKSTDYGQTWTETPNVLNYNVISSFSNNGNNIFEGDRISLDGGNHWTPTNAPIPAGKEVAKTGISDDGKKLFINTEPLGGGSYRIMTLLTSVDGGRTWHSEDLCESRMAMSNDGSKLFNMYLHNDDSRFVYRLATLPTPQPVTPGAGAGGTVAPSTASTSATPGQKPGKASGRLAETGASTWMVGGLAVIAVAAGALVLRKRL